MKVDLHNHTPRCNHAQGTPREYLERAISQGIEVYGFADHAPMEFDKSYRMAEEEMEEYERELKEIKEEFKDKIEILIGYEVDFTPLSSFSPKIAYRKVDYLIGSIHFLDQWGFDNPEFLRDWEKRDVDDVYREYFFYMREMVKSGYFQIVGHLDLIKVFGHRPTRNIEYFVKELLKEIKKREMAVELNTSGWRKPVGELYPSDEVLQLMAEMKIPITFSSDAHSPDHVGYKLDEAIAKAKSYGWKEGVFFRNKELVTFPL
ncbi:MAG: histidinol phosphate phosphatase [Epsilonproteobacteria bacterium]|nr:histidinol phosphate phosphatase [Campylobacterota bacterium]NPA89065.1 histidinol-phosphatase [Campylobacterota bacterium]